MMGPRPILAALGALAFSLASASLSAAERDADAAGLAGLQRCVAVLDPITDIGYERVVARCPDLPRALDAASWSALLPPNWRTRSAALSRDGLVALAALVTERESVQPERAMPDPKQVRQTLADVGAIVDDQSSRWQRLKRWLRSVFTRSQGNERDGVLRRMFGPIDVSDAISRMLAYAGYGLLIGFAGFVVFQELRTTGLLGGHQRARRVRGIVDAHANERIVLADVAAAPLSARPGLYLRLLAEVWQSKMGSQPTPAMTATEFGRLIRPAMSSNSDDIAALTSAADAVRYGARIVPNSDLEAAEHSGRTLLEALRVVPVRVVEWQEPR
jgi:hypothetical protein